MRKWIFPCLLILSLLVPVAVGAQNAITLSSLQIQIWPEYDKPGVLVIYQLKLANTTTLPASIIVRIPVAAGNPYAVASRQVDGSLYNMDFTRVVSGDWALVSFTATTPDIQLEYYDPGLTKNSTARHYQYTWTGDYAVSQLTIQVQQPFDASNMRISPSLGAGITGSDNLTYFTQDIGAISASQTINITVDYTKSTDALSAESQSVQPSAPIPQSTATDGNISTWLPWILGILGAGLIAGGIIWFVQTGRQRPNQSSRKRRPRVAKPTPESSSGSSESAIYCSHCGKRASPGDVYCRSCGTPIRTK